MFISSRDSLNFYPNNTYDDFIVEFDRVIQLPESCAFGFNQSWQFALTEVSLDFANSKPKKTLPESAVILTDLCSTSYISGTEAGVLRIIGAGSEEIGSSLGQIYYIGTNKNSFNRIRIQVRDRDLKPLMKDGQVWPINAVLKCTLHFIRA